MTTRRDTLALLAAASLCAFGRVQAQTRAKVWRIGYLTNSPLVEPPTPERAAFLAGLRDLGYEVGRNLFIEARSAQYEPERSSELVADLVKIGVELIVVTDPEGALAVRAVGASLPVVFTAFSDPVLSGLALSYSRPGGNFTGTTFIAAELVAKRVELIRAILPQARRMAVLRSVGNPATEQEWIEARNAGNQLGIAAQEFAFDQADEVLTALETMERTRPDALLVIVDQRTRGFRKIIADAALRIRIPSFAGWSGFVESGALASYAPDFRALFRRAAYYVDRILKGAKPADLPIEQPTNFELAINLKTGQALGITFPRTVLLRADRVIE